MTVRYQHARRASLAPIVVETVQEMRNLSDLGPPYPVVMIASLSDPQSGATYEYTTGAAPGTHVDNGTTVIVPTGGNGSSAYIQHPKATGTGLPAATAENQILLSGAAPGFTWGPDDMDMGRY